MLESCHICSVCVSVCVPILMPHSGGCSGRETVHVWLSLHFLLPLFFRSLLLLQFFLLPLRLYDSVILLTDVAIFYQGPATVSPAAAQSSPVPAILLSSFQPFLLILFPSNLSSICITFQPFFELLNFHCPSHMTAVIILVLFLFLSVSYFISPTRPVLLSSVFVFLCWFLLPPPWAELFVAVFSQLSLNPV